MKEKKSYYISITALNVKSTLLLPKFFYHVIHIALQSRAAEGNVLTDLKRVDGRFHTMTVWEDKESMRKFMFSGAHAKAMKIIKEIANMEWGTKVHGYQSESIPSWEEALEIWDREGKIHGKAIPTKPQDCATSVGPRNLHLLGQWWSCHVSLGLCLRKKKICSV